MEGMKELKKRYIFWVGNIKYSGNVISETNTHWLINDIKEGEIEIPKTAVRKEINGGGNND